jgi:hypothetical protein
MITQTTPRNSSTSRYNSNNTFGGQSRKFKASSQPNFSLSDKTCGCLTPLHLRKVESGQVTLDYVSIETN